MAGSATPRRWARIRCGQRIARHYHDAYGVAVEAERVVVTTGSSGGFILAFLACFQPGARVAITAPGYPAYRNILIALGLEPVAIEVGPRDALCADAGADRQGPCAKSRWRAC